MTERVFAGPKNRKSCGRLNCQVMDEQMEVGKLEKERSRLKEVQWEGENNLLAGTQGVILITL